jgi:hypothetical protein
VSRHAGDASFTRVAVARSSGRVCVRMGRVLFVEKVPHDDTNHAVGYMDI